MSGSLRARLARLEGAIPTQFDPDAEAEEYGELAWDVNGWRCYNQETPEGSRLAVVNGRTSLVYDVVGLDVADLT